MSNLAIKGGSELEVYARLIRALVPRMRGMSIFSASGELHWSTDIAVNEPMRRMVLESMRDAGNAADAPGALINDGEPNYILWLRPPAAAANAAPFAAVVVRCLPGTEAETRSLVVLHSLLRPALEIMSRELLSHQQVQTLRTEVAGHNQDLDMLLNMSGSDATAESSDGDELKTILRAATEHVLGGLAAIIVPEKGMVLIHQAPGNAMDANLVSRAHRHLMSSAQVRQKAIVVNRMQHPSGIAEKAYRLLACPVARQDGRTIGVLALFRTLAMPEFTLRQARLAELLARRVSALIASSYDALTGLMNRPTFERRVHSVLGSDRAGARTWSALAIDSNRTHVINDTFGMHVGDRVIAQLGELLRQRLPPGALAARISGDRFAVLMRAGLDDAARFAEALRTGAEMLGAGIAVGVGEGAVSVSISVGVAAIEAHVEEFTHAFAPAETACKAANDRGRNRVEIFREADESIIRRYTDLNLVTDLRGAIATGRLFLNAQMMVPLGNTHQRPHFELLLRMLGGDGETVGPDSFMSAAQRYQLMPEIDRWVVSEALALLKPHAALLARSPVVFTINCSGQSLRDASFTQFLVDSVAASGINPQALCFELTESAAVGNLANTESLMLQLRKLGCGLALDDFGTGLSSLSYLRSLPITMLKIDGSFVRDVLRDSKAEFTIQAIAQLARSMSLITVAEYVETDEIRRAVARLGVDYAQGFAIGRPVPIVEVLEQLPLYAAIADGARDEGSAPLTGVFPIVSAGDGHSDGHSGATGTHS
jgi:diguanylate cyclase (GGDEF)-like protein